MQSHVHDTVNFQVLKCVIRLEDHWNVAGPIFVGGALMIVSLGLAVGTHDDIQSWHLLTEEVNRKKEYFMSPIC